jgi:hypothetical protein
MALAAVIVVIAAIIPPRSSIVVVPISSAVFVLVACRVGEAKMTMDGAWLYLLAMRSISAMELGLLQNSFLWSASSGQRPRMKAEMASASVTLGMLLLVSENRRIKSRRVSRDAC